MTRKYCRVIRLSFPYACKFVVRVLSYHPLSWLFVDIVGVRRAIIDGYRAYFLVLEKRVKTDTYVKHQIDENSKYSRNHVWLRFDDKDSTLLICGVTNYSDLNSSEAVFIEMPFVGDVKIGNELCLIETASSIGEIASPLNGTIVEVNSLLEEEPQYVNKDSFGQGWLVKLKVADLSALDNMLTAEQYREWLIRVEASRTLQANASTPDDMIGTIVGNHEIVTINAIGAEHIVFNLLNLDTGERDRVYAAPRARFGL